MSQTDLERLAKACEKDAVLREELAALTQDPDAWRSRARERGYDLTRDEAASLISSTSELSDEDLEAVAGGWDGEEPPPDGDEPPPGGGE